MALRLVVPLLLFVSIPFVSLAPSSFAVTLPRAEGVIGKLRQYRVKERESLIEIARRFDIGFNEISAANPEVDPFVPKAGTMIVIPTAWIPPAVSSTSAIVINIPEFRLYFFTKRAGRIATFPLGIGDQGTDTPVGRYRVVEKIVRPAWHVPNSIRKQRRLPAVVPPGPNNPLGSHALRLSLESILIHGTNRPWGIGRRSSHGCLRLYPEDIVQLYSMVPRGMRVLIINQPIKLAVKDRRVFIEVHQYAPGNLTVGRALHMLAQRKLVGRTDFRKVIRAIKERKGYPVDISLDFEPPTPQLREPPPSILDWFRNPIFPVSW